LRDINNLRTRGLNYINGLTRWLLYLHLLLRITAQRAGVVRLSPQALNRSRDGFLIRGKCLSDGGVVVDVLSHHFQHLRKIYQRDECGIESLLLCRISERRARKPGVLRQPVIDIQDFLRIGGGGSDLGEQGIGIKGDWGQQLVQLFRGKRRCLAPRERDQNPA
jgi:hypothetical protein